MLGDTAVAVNPDDERYQALHRQATRTAAHGPHDSGHRRRVRRRGLRLGLREDHARARLQRLRRWACATTCRRSTSSRPTRSSTRTRRRRTAAWTASRRARRSSPISKPRACIEKIEPHKLKVPRGDRTNAVIEPYLTDQWYVKIAPLAEPAIEGGRGRPHEVRAGELVEDLLRMDAQHQGLVREPPALVGPSHSGLVRRSRQDLRRARRSRGAQEAFAGTDREAHAGPGRARHLVLLGAVAVLHAGLAGQDPRAEEVLSDQRAGHGLRHHLLLGRAHDDDGPEVHGRRAVHATCTSPA